MRLDSSAREVILQRCGSGKNGVGLGLHDAAVGGASVHAPVVEDLGDVADAASVLYGFEGKIVVLRTGDLVGRQLHAVEDVAAHHEHVHHVVVRVEQIAG